MNSVAWRLRYPPGNPAQESPCAPKRVPRITVRPLAGGVSGPGAARTTEVAEQILRGVGRIFLEAAPAVIDPNALCVGLVARPHVVDVHGLHVRKIASGRPPRPPTSWSSPASTATPSDTSSTATCSRGGPTKTAPPPPQPAALSTPKSLTSANEQVRLECQV
ncbi:hypothetical protein GCM10009647_048860 [Streptomyces sanglieri]